MKKHLFPALWAISLFVVAALDGVSMCRAQESAGSTDENPLFTATGPNTVGARHLQLSAWGSWYGYGEDCNEQIYYYDAAFVAGGATTYTLERVALCEPGLGAGLRWGIGRRFELGLGLEGSWARNGNRMNVPPSGSVTALEGTTLEDHSTSQSLRPTLGINVLVSDAGPHGWPQIAAFVQLRTLLVRNPGGEFDFPIRSDEGVAGLQFRNRFGGRWALDYSVHYHYWGDDSHVGSHPSFTAQTDWHWQFSVMGRWLASERLLVGFGMENLGGCAEVLWTAAPGLRVKARGVLGASHEPFHGGTLLEGRATVGVEWVIR